MLSQNFSNVLPKILCQKNPYKIAKKNFGFSIVDKIVWRLTDAKNHDSGFQMGAFPGEAVGRPMRQKA